MSWRFSKAVLSFLLIITVYSPSSVWSVLMMYNDPSGNTGWLTGSASFFHVTSGMRLSGSPMTSVVG